MTRRNSGRPASAARGTAVCRESRAGGRSGRGRLAAVLAVGMMAAGLAVAGTHAATGARARAQAGAQAAADYPAALFRALAWRNLGPNRAGRSIACAGSSARPLEYYSGATGGGLWKTTDGGTTWAPVTDSQIHSSSVGAIAVSPSNPDIVYIGMGEKELRGNILQGDGVYKTTDGGKTWRHMGLDATETIARIRVDPTHPDIVYVAALGHPSDPNPERGIYKSTDGGENWRKVLYRDDRSGGVDLSIDPRNPQVIYAALWESWRVSWGMSSGGPGSGLFKSTDAGEHWTEITRNPGLPQGVIGKIGVSVSPADDNRVYAIVEAKDGGVFRSDDAGATWTLVNNENTLRQRAFYYADITADPIDKDTVYGENVGAYKSTDGGKTWVSFHGGDSHDMWIDPTNNQRIIVSNDSGSTVTTNGGRTWTPQTYPTAQLYHVVLTHDDPYQVCGAQQDSSTVCVQSAGGGRGGNGMWAAFYAVGGGESGYIAPSPTDPDILYAGSQGALLTRFDRRTGWSRDIEPYPRFFSGENSASLPERWQWTYPIVFDNFDPHKLYTSSQHLWMTTNDGQSWTKISPDLTRHDPKTLGDSGGPITHDMNGPEVFATIFSIAPSHMEAGTIWTGSDDGMVFVTRDGGGHWADVTPPQMPALARVSLVEASRHNAGEAYVAANNYLQNDDRKPYLFRTRDYGKTWTTIASGIAADDFLHAVREDVGRAGLLFAGTEHGIYVSFDDGDHWQSLSLNLPDVQVSDIAVAPHDVVISTMGRSFYTLENMDVLRQFTPALAAPEQPHLFRPVDAIRPSHPLQVDYFLPARATDVSLAILDAKGAVIQTFRPQAGGRGGRGRGGAAGGAGRGGRGGGGAVTDNPGMNRFTWNLQYPGAIGFPGMVLWSANVNEGPIAVPGQYTVRLTVDGVSQTAPFRIVEDPRQTANQADLEAEFALATRVRDAVSRADQAVIDARSLRDQVNARLTQTSTAALQSAGEALAGKLTGIETTIYQTQSHASEDPLNFPIKINNRIAHLMSDIQGAQDGRPTEQTYAIFEQLNGELDGILAQFHQIEASDVAAFNRQLAAENLPPIAVAPAATPIAQEHGRRSGSVTAAPPASR